MSSNATTQQTPVIPLNTQARTALEDLQAFDPLTLVAIERCPSLVAKLNSFFTSAARNGKLPTIALLTNSTSSGYDVDKNQIQIGSELFNSPDQYLAVTNLAHEVGHAMGRLRDYGNSSLSPALCAGE